MIRPFYYDEKAFSILDQRVLPQAERWIRCREAAQVVEAIRTLAVRGAPAIGIAAAYGLVLEARKGRAAIERAGELLVQARPTAVNLAWAVGRMLRVLEGVSEGELDARALAEAQSIWEEEKSANAALSRRGADLFTPGRPLNILTHCNTGTLATGGMGTALGVIRELFARGLLKGVFVDETRPLLQGGRLTAYELMQDAIPCTLITDSMAGWLMRQGRVDAVIVGADRIAANLDAANKIGTYSLAVLARAHALPFYIAAPMSTFDQALATGEGIPIEERQALEVLGVGGQLIAPQVPVYNPSFDVTPHRLITAVITPGEVFYPAPAPG